MTAAEPMKTAVFFQRAEIERDVVHRGRQDAAGSAARQIGVEGMAVGHAATKLVDQFAHGDPAGASFMPGFFTRPDTE